MNTEYEGEENRLSSDDFGFLYGLSIFETFFVDHKGQVFLLSDHIRRLYDSLVFFEIELNCPQEEFTGIVLAYIRQNKIQNKILRVAVSAGNKEKQLKPGIFFALRANSYSPEKIDQGCTLMISDHKRNETSLLVKHKTANYMENYFIARAAIRQGFDDAVFLNTQNQVTETTKSNLFFVKDGVLHTPNVQCGLLPGVIREWVIRKAASLGIDCREGYYGLAELMEADEVLITNSVMGIMHGQKIDEKCYNDGFPGEMTAWLKKELAFARQGAC